MVTKRAQEKVPIPFDDAMRRAMRRMMASSILTEANCAGSMSDSARRRILTAQSSGDGSPVFGSMRRCPSGPSATPARPRYTSGESRRFSHSAAAVDAAQADFLHWRGRHQPATHPADSHQRCGTLANTGHRARDQRSAAGSNIRL